MLNVSSIFKTALLLATLVLSACSVSPHKAEIINVENEKWRIAAVGAYQADTGWLVKGKLSSPNIFSLPKGHIMISIVDEKGGVIERKKVNFRKILSNVGRHYKHQYGRAVFLAHFKSIPQNAVILAEFKTSNSNTTISP